MSFMHQRAAMCLFAAVASAAAGAAELSGRISDADGRPLAGVMISVIEEGGAKTTTRYTGRDGGYAIEDLPAAEVAVRARLIGYGDRRRDSVTLAGRTIQDFQLSAADRSELLDDLPAHVWAERVRIEDPLHQGRFRITCMMCHQQGYAGARWPQTQEQWQGVFDRMAHKAALLTPATREVIADALLDAYRLDAGESPPRVPEPPSGRVLDAEITEWRLASVRSSLHDVAVGPDGRAYATDTGTESLWRLDPASGAVREFQFAEYDPDRRNFMGFPSKTLPHSIIQGPEGNLWATLALSHEIVKLDPATERVTRYPLPFGSSYPHTMRFDDRGRLWFSITFSNELGMFDPETETFEIIDLPVRNWRQWLVARSSRAVLWLYTAFRFETTPDPEIIPVPYGIDITPDGTVWVSQFNNRALVGYRPDIGEMRSYDTPFYGPRRFRSDSTGRLWIPAYAEGRVYRFDPEDESFTPYDLPTGKGDASYALAVNPRNDDVWICGSNSDTMIRMDSETGAFDVYPFPTRVTFCREIDFDDRGNVWTSYSNYPTQAIEGGGVPVIVRIDP